MSELASLRDAATRLVQKFGREATLRRKSTTPGEASEPWRSLDGQDTDVVATMAFFDARDLPHPDGEARRGERVALVAADSLSQVPPRTKDRVVDGGTVFTVEAVEQVRPGDKAVVYVLDLAL